MPDIVEHIAAGSICTVLSLADMHWVSGSMARLPQIEATEGAYVDEYSYKSAMTQYRVQHGPRYYENKVSTRRCIWAVLFILAQMVKEGLVEPYLFLLAMALRTAPSLSICSGSVESPACRTSEAVISRLGRWNDSN